MRIVRAGNSEVDPSIRHGVVTIGNFDGVHRGHRALLARTRQVADRLGGPAVGVTFDPHPAAVLRPNEPIRPLTWTEFKFDLLAETGIDAVLVLPADMTLLNRSAEDFFRAVLLDRLGVKGIVEGADFRFGRGREGDVETLRALAAPHGIVVEDVPAVEVDGKPVSSSRIRQLITEGAVADAGRLLGRPFRTCGLVVHGAARGRTLGYPTANLQRVRTILPREGIYAGAAWVEGCRLPAAVSLGGNPTFDEYSVKFEVFILDFEGDLYDQWLEVEFLERLRDVEKHDSVESLLSQMQEDVAATACLFDELFGAGKAASDAG
ncbi:bifunctional riboflavin kinase/FAD synthetase [Thermostilla marina]